MLVLRLLSVDAGRFLGPALGHQLFTSSEDVRSSACVRESPVDNFIFLVMQCLSTQC